ncbi:MAG: Trm112 family protein [Aquificaceae bacterium]|nr:Trm112 family protein [Aquificaceae bacterium]MCX8059730.1 Trm112 family protein [Aquificaceae bacterium]MDW8096579.1 Trm112 family protein [Aquificaceae bacterium]
MLSRELLDILACPICKGELLYDEKRNLLVCYSCRVYYPVEEDIPLLLTDYARPLEELGGAPQEGSA